MPTYTYKCRECEGVVEIEHSMTQTREGEPCPVTLCQGLQRKVFTPTPAVFKGRGWYSKGG